MEAPKDSEKPAGNAAPKQDVPQDALEKTNEELGEVAKTDTPTPSDAKPAKKPNAFKQFLKRFNVYLLLFLLVVVIGVAVAVVGYLNGKKTPKAPSTANQTLTQDTLNQLANSDATVGDTGQTLTVQGNAVFSGQVLVRSNLNVAGTIQLGGAFTVPELTVSNTANLANTQINALQVATGSTFQGLATFQSGINVAGSASFTGAVTVGQLTVTKLVMSGNSVLEVPNHIAFTGASPGRSINQNVLGAGGTASINGSDMAGTVNINTGTSTQAGCFTTITFSRPFTNTPHVVITPVGSAAGQTQYYVTRNTINFSICTNNAPPTSQVFAFDYFITD